MVTAYFSILSATSILVRKEDNLYRIKIKAVHTKGLHVLMFRFNGIMPHRVITRLFLPFLNGGKLYPFND